MSDHTIEIVLALLFLLPVMLYLASRSSPRARLWAFRAIGVFLILIGSASLVLSAWYFLEMGGIVATPRLAPIETLTASDSLFDRIFWGAFNLVAGLGAALVGFIAFKSGKQP